jgi:hypothetical protein
MSQWVYKVVCPLCKNPLSKANKKIGIYQCELSGRGRKVVKDAELTDDEDDLDATRIIDDALAQAT